jgi:hypothetical protein
MPAIGQAEEAEMVGTELQASTMKAAYLKKNEYTTHFTRIMGGGEVSDNIAPIILLLGPRVMYLSRIVPSNVLILGWIAWPHRGRHM